MSSLRLANIVDPLFCTVLDEMEGRCSFKLIKDESAESEKEIKGVKMISSLDERE
jgi:hypothetical protein